MTPGANFQFTSRGRSTSGPRAVSAVAEITGVARALPISPTPSTTSPTIATRVLRSMDVLLSLRFRVCGGGNGGRDRMLVPPFAAFAPVPDRTLGPRVEHVRAGAHAVK